MLAMAALLAGAGLAYAGDSNTFDASVSVLSPDQTGFIIGGQVAVNGLGSGALTMSRSAADMSIVGKASSTLDPQTEVVNGQTVNTGFLNGVNSNASILSSLNFDRQVNTSGSLVGQGSVVSSGQAIASMGSAGAASANTTTAGTRDTLTGNPTYTPVIAATPTSTGLMDVAVTSLPGGQGSASASSTSQGSLNGSLSTSNSLQLLGTSGLFAGSNSLNVGEQNKAIAYGSSTVKADGVSGINLTGATPNTASATAAPTATGDGALFNVSSKLSNPDSQIAMSVSNAGNGTISLTTSTGGFFTGGGAAGGSATHVDNGSFFNPQVTTTHTSYTIPMVVN